LERIGVLGGTFDPVHLGHIAMAGSAIEALGLVKVILVPAGLPMSKVNRRVTPADDRLEMLRLAVKDRPGLMVSTIEIERPGPSYTVDTLTALRGQMGDAAELYFILGWDSLSQLPEWRGPDRLIKMCRLAAVPRPGCPRPDMELLESRIPGISKRVIFLEKPFLDISATQIKEMASRGEKINHLVPGPVAVYIEKHKLYKAIGGKR
jgi:nicotinate-nucleotide adenylyltransferase